MSVALVHGQAMSFFNLGPNRSASASLTHFVEFFFTLSGFVLAYNYRDLSVPGARRKFLFSRIARLAPLYYLSGIFSLTVPGLNNLGANPLLPVAAYLFFLQDWFQPTLVLECFNAAAHSLSSETFYYFTFFCLAALPRRLEAIAFALIVITLTLFFPLPDPPAPFFLLPLLCGVYFPLGVLAARLFIVISQPKPELARSAAKSAHSLWQTIVFTGLEGLLWMPACAIAYKISGASDFALVPNWPPGLIVALLGVVFASIIFVYALERGLVSRLLRIKWLTVLGDASYAIFLLHYPIFVYCMRFLPGASGRFGWLVLAGIVALSILVYFLIERPCRKLIMEGLIGPRTPAIWPQLLLRLGLPMVLCLLFIRLPLRPIPVLAEVKKEKWSDSATGVSVLSRPVRFGGLEMLDAKIRTVGSDRELLILWRDGESAFRAGYQITHLLDAKGQLVKNLDHQLSRASRACFETDASSWVDRVIVPEAELSRAGVKELGIAVCLDTRCILLPVSRADKVPLNLNCGRLILPLR